MENKKPRNSKRKPLPAYKRMTVGIGDIISEELRNKIERLGVKLGANK
ncbi:hypothetical protein [Bacillus sp. AFS041924]|nr:hypothetical protein [Bacillus sp. AFS041924]